MDFAKEELKEEAVQLVSLYVAESMLGIDLPNDELAKEVMGASERSGEKLWRMLLEENCISGIFSSKGRCSHYNNDKTEKSDSGSTEVEELERRLVSLQRI